MAATYILIDTTLIGFPLSMPWTKRRRKPDWMVPLYDREAITVSPVLIDIERAFHCNAIDAVMGLVNAQRPQLGISFIETELTMLELQNHFREFIYIKTEDDAELTLRFADCVVLPALSSVLTAEQWSAMVAPFNGWIIHGRDGLLTSLPILKNEIVPRLPLVLSNDQIALLGRAMKTDQILANLRKMRPGKHADYSTATAFEYAHRAREMWIAAGHDEDTELVLLVRAVFDTDGRLLHHVALDKVLAQTDPVLRRKDLHRIASTYLAER
ncbi:DUF4123 domain-containing protein [Duganella sp. FT94W]|uniref:DUF4123 domain-containing protein n=1 Tax=Duganella lactea TaxID=2692173 RepID=A0ABW9VB04_9BURK|nr:DUF4123 domain-containing protein [Duganella lactea]MYM36808.1 DUF4123 domain-containing protein [Duganella lactea]